MTHELNNTCFSKTLWRKRGKWILLVQKPVQKSCYFQPRLPRNFDSVNFIPLTESVMKTYENGGHLLRLGHRIKALSKWAYNKLETRH